jgi:glycosyltransferase involved in cell wall biosynthesis
MLDMLAPHYGEPARARVIHNGRDASVFVPSARKESFVLAAGRVWDEAKNIDALDRQSPRLAWPVYIAGDAHAPHGGEHPLGAARFFGVLPPSALAWWMGRASVFAAPARYEPFGLSTLEAALAGCALVVGDIPSLREVWGDAACYVPPDDLDAIAAALDELAADHARRAGMAERAARRASEFTPARMGDAYLRLYEELCASGRTGRSGAASQPMEVTA